MSTMGVKKSDMESEIDNMRNYIREVSNFSCKMSFAPCVVYIIKQSYKK